MSSDNTDGEIAKILDARHGRAALPSGGEHLGQHPNLQRLLEAADLAWTSQQSAPPLFDDPVAAMLGLVPDPEMELDGRALATARKRSGLTVSALAQRLVARGWDVTAKEVFAWEGGKNPPRVPALISALAVVTGVDADRLRRQIGEGPERERLETVVASAAFTVLAERWARIQGTTLALAASALESRMRIAVHRSGAPDSQVLLEALEAMVSAVEDTGGQ